MHNFHATARVTAQVGPVFVSNNGFTTVVRNGAGDYTLTLNNPIAPGNCAITVTPLGVYAVSGLVSFHVNHVVGTPGTIQITSGQEQPAGAASAATDISFSIEVIRDNDSSLR